MKRTTPTLATLISAGLLAAGATLAGGPATNLISVTTTADGIDEFDGFCSLREAIHNANLNDEPSPVAGECPAGSASVTDVIVLASGETYALTVPGAGSDEGDLDLFQNVSIGLDLRIETSGGVAPATIDQTVIGQRVMEVQSIGLELDNLVIRDGSVDGAGGGILNSGNLTLTRVQVLGNSATAGGGLHNTGIVQITESEFQLNSASFIGGGAIFNTGATSQVRLDATLVRANEAPVGGGIYNEGEYVEIDTGSAVNLNQATGGSGGGVATLGTAQTWVGNSSFEGNQANADGGAIHNEGTLHLWVLDSTFESNNAVRGGAISSTGSASVFANRSTFRNNSSGSHGGAVYANHLFSNDSLYETNTAALGDGGGAFGQISATIRGTTFVGNSADQGGGLYADNITIEDSTFTGNQASSDGGGVFVGNYGPVLRARIENNTAAGNGGGLYLLAGALFGSDILQTLVTGNQAGGQGGGLWLGSDVSIGNTTIHNNAATAGGGLYIDAASEVTAVNMTLAGHLAGQDLHKFGKLTMGNSIIFTPGQPDCETTLNDPPIHSLGNNIVDDNACFFEPSLPSDQLLTDPMLDVLAENGGPTATLALLPGSPAIDTGSNDLCAAAPVDGIDQRGGERPVGAACDIGAFETGAAVLPDVIFQDGFETP